MKLIDNIKTNNLFNVTSITFNYSLNTTSKSYTTLNHEVFEHLHPLLFNGSLEARDVGVGGLVGGLLQKIPHCVVQRVQVRAGGGPEVRCSEISKVGFTELLHIRGCVARSIILGLTIVAFSVVGLQPWQDVVPKNLVVDISRHLLFNLEEYWEHFFLVRGHKTKYHNLGWMFGPEGALDISY